MNWAFLQSQATVVSPLGNHLTIIAQLCLTLACIIEEQWLVNIHSINHLRNKKTCISFIGCLLINNQQLVSNSDS